MADIEQLHLLGAGVERWNAWRRGNAELRPDLTGALLQGVDLRAADFRGAALTEADLGEANLSNADLASADLSDAKLGNADLSRANLHRAILHSADLSYSDLRRAHLSGAQLLRAHLTAAKLANAWLRKGMLGYADLCGADLTDADLSGANLSYANLNGAILTGSNLTGVVMQSTMLGDIDLGDVVGLDTVNHLGPSTIGVDTLYHSRGRIPDVFLRGCGVPEALIQQLRSLTGQGADYYSCFISHSSADQEFVRLLHARLQAEGLRVWYAPEDMQGGRKLEEQIDEAIRVHDKLILVLSENSMGSTWVRTEMRKARRRENKEGRRMLFPIALVPFAQVKEWESFFADLGEDVAEEIREYFIPDWAGWKDHDTFEQALQCLLRDLRAPSVSAPI